MIADLGNLSSPPPFSLLSLDSVRVRFGKILAVGGVSFNLQAGQLLGLIGPNGAGKTTLIRAIVGLQPLTSGEVRVMGEPFRGDVDTSLRQVGFTPDTPAVYEELTVRDFLKFVARGYDLTGPMVDERIDFWLEKVWLTDKANQKIKGLSRGMRQRIGIARTLLPNPSVILLDEPAAGLDPAGRVQFRQLLCDLRDQGKALIVSSHILSDLADYCTHVGIMARGRMVRYGTVTEVAGHADETRSLYTILLAHPVSALEEKLAGIEGVTDVSCDRDRATLEYDSDREQAAALLVELLRRQVPVAGFTAHAPDLEAAYLRAGVGQVD